MGAIDDHEHFRGEFSAPSVEQHAGHLHLVDLIGVALLKKMQPGEPMLPVDDEIFPLRLAQMPDRLRIAGSLEPQRFIRKQQDGSRYHRLRHDGFIKVDDLFDFLPIEEALKALFAALDAGDELRHVVVFPDMRLGDFLPLEIVTAGELNLCQKLCRVVADEIKRAFFLTDSCCQHDSSLS